MEQNKSIQNLVPLAQLDRLAQEQGFGTMQVIMEVHDKKIVAVSGQRFRRKTYKLGDGYEDAMREFVNDIRNWQVANESGNVTLTVKLHKGDVKEIFIQTNFRQVFPTDCGI